MSENNISTYYQALLRLDELDAAVDSTAGTCSTNTSRLMDEVLDVLSIPLPGVYTPTAKGELSGFGSNVFDGFPACDDVSYCAEEDPSYQLKRLIEHGRLKLSDALVFELGSELGNEKRWANEARDLMANKVGEISNPMTGEKIRSYPSLDHAYGAVLGDIEKMEGKIAGGSVVEAAELYLNGKDTASREFASREALYTDAARAATDHGRIEFVKGAGVVALAAGASAATGGGSVLLGVSPEISGAFLAPAAWNTVELAGHGDLVRDDRTILGDIGNWVYEYAFTAFMFRYLGMSRGALLGKTLAGKAAEKGVTAWAKGHLATSAGLATWSPMETTARQALELGSLDSDILYETTASPEALLEQQAFLLAVEIFGYPVNLAAKPLNMAAKAKYLAKAYERYGEAAESLEAGSLAPGRSRLALQAGALGEPPQSATAPEGETQNPLVYPGRETVLKLMKGARRSGGNQRPSYSRVLEILRRILDTEDPAEAERTPLLDSQRMMALKDLGICLRATDDLSGSIAALEEAARISDSLQDPPFSPYAELAISHLTEAWQQRRNRPAKIESAKKALQAVETAIQRENEFSRNHSIKAEILQLLERPAEALRAVEQAISLDEKAIQENTGWKGDHNLHYIRAELLRKLGKYSEALGSIDRALSLMPEKHRYKLLKARLMLDLTPSLDEAGEAAEVHPAEAHLLETLKLLRGLREQNPGNFSARENEIDALLRLARLNKNNPEKRREYCETAYSLLQELKDTSPAKFIQQVFELEALAGLGEEMRAETIKAARQLARADHHNISYALRRAAETMSGMGEHELAIILVGKTLKFEPGNPLNHLKLVEIYEAAERFSHAIDAALDGIERVEGRDGNIDRLVEALIRIRLRSGRTSDAQRATNMAREAGIPEAIIARAYAAAGKEPPAPAPVIDYKIIPAPDRDKVGGTIIDPSGAKSVAKMVEAMSPAGDAPEFVPRDVGIGDIALSQSGERTQIGTLGGHPLTLTISNGADIPGSTRWIDVKLGEAWCRDAVLKRKEDGTYEIHDSGSLLGARRKKVTIPKKHVLVALNKWLEAANRKKLGIPESSPEPTPARAAVPKERPPTAPGAAYRVLMTTSMQRVAENREYMPVAEVGDRMLSVRIPDGFSDTQTRVTVEVRLGSEETAEEVGSIVMEKLKNGKWLVCDGDKLKKDKLKDGSVVRKLAIKDAIEEVFGLDAKGKGDEVK